jgi:hypothetical protein
MQSHIDQTRRQLTYDELKAAEAAFLGYAFNEDWYLRHFNFGRCGHRDSGGPDQAPSYCEPSRCFRTGCETDPTHVEAIQMLDRDRTLATDRSAFPAVLEPLVAPIVSVTDRVVTGQCKGGETGYWATVQEDNGILLFLVSTPDTSVVSTKNFVCWINPNGRIMAWGRESAL